MFIIRRSLGFILLILLFGCNSAPEKPDTQAFSVDTKIAVSAEVNPDINNRPSPIVVRIFELKNLGNYTESDFYDLFENYESVLGGDLLASEQFHLKPGDTHTLENSLATETKYIAVIAAFRDINRAMWKDAIIIPVEKNTQILIYVDKLSVSVWKK